MVFLPAFSGSDLKAEQVAIYFKSSPSVEHLRPFAQPATLSLLVTAPGGKPVVDGWVEVRLEAPEPQRFFSTDFPLVEGKPLLEMRLPLRVGKTEWRYLFPIRGVYRLTVDYFTAEGKQASKTFSLAISEHATKWYFLGTFILALFGIGVVAGRVFSGVAPWAKGAVTTCVFISAVFLLSPAASQAIEEKRYFGSVEIEPASVGQTARVHWRLAGQERPREEKTLLTLAITHLEKEKTVFMVARLLVPGEFSMNFHFVDGADHRIRARAELPGGISVRTERIISVTATEPPATAILPPMLLFLGVIAAGLAAGRWSRIGIHRRFPRGEA